ncbi:MAG: TA system VapC family ribonuclease toxin [Acidobacteriota bacterium]
MLEVTATAAFGFSDVVLSGFLRIVTNSRIFPAPSPLTSALDYANGIRDHPNAIAINAGPRHWQIFTELCTAIQARGSLVPDAYLAALAIEHDLEFASTDADFERFDGLRWRNPLA